jgi:hypothetical protein
LIGVKIGDGHIQEIDLDKALSPIEIVTRDEIRLVFEVRVTGSSKKLIISKPEDNLQQKAKSQTKPGLLYFESLLKKLNGQKLAIELKLRGIGLSFIDESPQELLFMTLYGIKLSYY